jgi:hypothetical protein
MIGSFRFEGGAQKTLERMNLFVASHLSKSIPDPFDPTELGTKPTSRSADRFLLHLSVP